MMHDGKQVDFAASAPTIPPMAFCDDKTTVMELRRLVRSFVDEREWRKYHQPKNLSMSLAVETAELMEHFQWLNHSQSRRLLKNPRTRRMVADEMADVLAFLLSLANAAGIDIAASFEAKMESNRRKYPAGRVRGRKYRKPGRR